MATLRDIRRKISSVRKTRQITNAMKMVAAAKLRRAQENITAARPYADKILEVIGDLSARVDINAHPLLAQQEGGKILLVVVTADRGLCGGFNANILRNTMTFMLDRQGKEISFIIAGRKGRDFLRRRRFSIVKEYVNIFNALSYTHGAAIGRDVIDAFLNHEADEVYIIYNEFRSIIQQRVTTRRLLPITSQEIDVGESRIDFIYEPSPEAILGDLLNRYIEVQVYRALLESLAGEYGARMTAMDSATRNASEMIDQLTLTMNKTRQASITRELIEVVSGAEALKG